MKESPLQQVLLKLKSVFPEAVTETKQTDDDGKPYYIYALKDEFIRQLQEVGLDMADDQNRYELQFPGKQTAKATAFTPCYKTLIADKEQSKNFDDTSNVFIEGDNLDALRMLQNSYRGKIKMIYIDPPYNTGGDDFVYPDDFSVKQKEYLRAAGVLDEDGVRQISEIQTGLKGRFHAGWLAFMYPRLKLARELLSDDGVIFISIDDNEQANLKLICDEIFGESNCLAQITWQGMDTIKNDAIHFSSNSEFILCYANRMDSTNILGIPKTEKQRKTYKNHDNDPRGDYLLTPLHAKSGTDASIYTYVFPNGQEWQPPKGSYPRFSKEKLNEMVRDSRIYLDPKGKKVPQRKTYWADTNGRMRPTTFWEYKEFGSTRQSNAELRKLLGRGVFDNPKPVRLIKSMIGMVTNTDSLILDFFAGSATTAHAVMQLNAEDSGNRKFILVQLPEEIKSKKSKESHQFCTKELKRPATIAEIAKERIRRAGKQVIEKSNDDMFAKDIDVGFRAFVIRDSLLNKGDNEQPLAKMEQAELKRYMIELKRENFEPLLYEALLKTGVTLNLPLVLDEIDDYPFAICDRRCYCVTENLTQQVVQGISEKHSDAFDILYYLSDALNTTVSYTEIEAVIHMAPGDKQIQGLAFY